MMTAGPPADPVETAEVPQPNTPHERDVNHRKNGGRTPKEIFLMKREDPSMIKNTFYEWINFSPIILVKQNKSDYYLIIIKMIKIKRHANGFQIRYLRNR